MVRLRRPPSQGWKTFLRNHTDGIASMDLFVVPTISFRLLYAFLVLQHRRRVILWIGVTAHPSAEWIARQLTEAYAWAQAPQYIIRDRDGIYGDLLIRRLRAMGIRDRPIAPRSPWQNGHTERLIGTIRRECLDHVVVFGEQHLRRLLGSYQRYYNDACTHLSVNKDAPASRAVQAVGHPGSADRTAITMAKWTYREAHRLDPTGVPRSCRGVRRAAPPPTAGMVPTMLR
jgi:transposase InsO family protein